MKTTAEKQYPYTLGKITAISMVFFAVFSAAGVARNSEYFQGIFYVLSLLLLLMVPLVILAERNMAIGASFILIPTLLVSLDTFFLRMGLFNIYAYLDGSFLYKASSEYIHKAVVLVLMGNVALWLGFLFPLSRISGKALGQKLYAWTSFPVRSRTSIIWMAFFIGVLIRMYLIHTGVGGYFSERSLREAALPYIQAMLLFENLSTLSLIAYFCIQLKKYHKPKWYAFGIMFFIELITLLFIGFKGQILFRFFYLAVAFVFITKKFPVKIALSGFLVLIIIFPINMLARSKFWAGEIEAGNITDIQRGFISAGIDAFSDSNILEVSAMSVEHIVRNSSHLEPLAMVVKYADETGTRFYGKDYLHIFIWCIPRAIWPSKPVVDSEWVTAEVYGMGRPATTALASTVPGNFYINFGMPGIITGFFVLGFFQRVISTGLLKINSLRFIPLIPFIIFTLALPQSSLGPQIGGAIRSLIFNIIVLSLMFPRVKKQVKCN